VPAETESDLIEAAQAGDRDAMDRLLRGQVDRVHSVCRRIARNEADAMDASQEALIAIARRIDRFEGRSSFSTWVHRVAANACLDELRRRSRRPAPGLPDLKPVIDSDAPFDQRLADRDQLSNALAELPDDFREPLVLRDVAGLDYAEIADVLDIPPGTVRSRIARARGRLATQLSSDVGHTSRSREPDDGLDSSKTTT